MARSLVLNATYEPLAVVSQRRAAVLILCERADALHGSGRMLRSERLELELPSVIRLRYYAKAPQRRSCAITRRSVFLRDGHRCQYCGAKAENIDHVHPRSRGGKHVWENVVASCRPCNTRKRDRLPAEIRMLPMTKPRPPHRFAWVSHAVGTVPQDWHPYLEPSRPAVAS